MKDMVAELGVVLSKEGPVAVVAMQGSGGCRGCAAAKMGLCGAGQQMTLRALDTLGTKPGDRVKVALQGRVKWQGYLLAFLMPLGGFVLGALGGFLLGAPAALGALAGLLAVLPLSFRGLRRLEATHSLYISQVLSAPGAGIQDSPEALDYLNFYLKRTSAPARKDGRGEPIRTADLSHPKRVR